MSTEDEKGSPPAERHSARESHGVMKAVTVALAAAAAALCWQALTVHCNRDGNWTALYCTGSLLPVPPSLSNENIYRFDGTGFDGQFYHYMTHDPFLGEGLDEYVDDPRLRYRRALVPSAAFILAGGASSLVDVSYLFLILASTALGVYWLARIATARGFAEAWGLAFLLLPAALASLDRLVVDGTLAALAVGFALYSETKQDRKLFLILMLAPLVRETGLLLLAATCLEAAAGGRIRRAAAFALAGIPTALWFAFVHSQTAAQDYPLSLIPLSGILKAFATPAAYADKHLVIARLDQAGDFLALTGVVVGFGLALRSLRTRGLTTAQIACVLFALLGILVQRTDHWRHVFDFGRVYSPMLLLIGIDSFRSRSWVPLLPVALMLPRIGLQLGSQIVGVALCAWPG